MDWQSGNGRIAAGEEVGGSSGVLIKGRVYERHYKKDSRWRYE